VRAVTLDTEESNMKLLGTALALLMSSGVAMADKCDTTAAKIAKSADLTAERDGRGISMGVPMSYDEDSYGAQLDCIGWDVFAETDKTVQKVLVFHTNGPPRPSQKWYDFVARSGSILTEVTQTLIDDSIHQCVRRAAAASNVAPNRAADEIVRGVHISCYLDNEGNISVFISNDEKVQ
jgi:hypothetical protein